MCCIALLEAISGPRAKDTSLNVELLKQAHINCRQYEAFLRVLLVDKFHVTFFCQSIWKIAYCIRWIALAFIKVLFHEQNDVITCAQNVEQQEGQLAARLQQLQTTVQSKMAVPTAQVYVCNYNCDWFMLYVASLRSILFGRYFYCSLNLFTCLTFGPRFKTKWFYSACLVTF